MEQRRTLEDAQVDAEIIANLQEAGLNVSESDMIRPSPAFVQAVCEYYLKSFLGFMPEECFQQNLPLLDQVEFPDLYTDISYLMIVFEAIKKLFLTISIDGFSFGDVVRPESYRIRSTFSHITNFANFRKHYQAIFKESDKQKAELLMEKENLEEAYSQASEKLNALRIQRTQEEPLIEEIKKELEAMASELRESKRIQITINSDIDRVKTARQELQDKSSANRSYISTLRQDINKLKAQIVDNPERLFQVVSELNANIASEKAALAVLDKKSRELQAKIDALHAVEQDLNKSFKMMESVKEEIEKITLLSKRISSEQEKITSKQSSLKDLNAQDTNLKRQLGNMQEKINKLQRQQVSKRESVEERFVQLRAESEELLVERSEVQKKIEANETVYREIAAKIAEAKKKHEQEVLKAVTACDKMRLQVEEYCAEMRKALAE